MTDKLLIERELLERIDETAICDGTDATISDDLFTQLVAALATPRQPEEGLEIRALEHNGITVSYRLASPHELRNGDPLVRLSDAQRAIAELREECEIHRNSAAGAHNQLRANRLETERLAVDWQAAVAERDTLRQQLAERDATNERLRVKLMTIASAEPGRHNIELAKAMAATGNNEAHAKWREAFDQCGRLAELLRQARLKMAYMLKHGEWHSPEELIERIDAELSEVK